MYETDWRLPEHRRDVFHDFYEFHLRYRSHPGCVYYLMPYLRERFGWGDEEALWFAFLNGNTQNPLTSLLLHQQSRTPDDADRMIRWYRKNYARLAWDTDRRYHKKSLEESTAGYISAIGTRTQRDVWWRVADMGFPAMWAACRNIPTFGRLSAFSYGEYLRIMGVPFDCDDLMIHDIDGSRSHRNGLCIVNALDHFDWHKSNPGFDGKYPRDLLDSLTVAGDRLLREARQRAVGKAWEGDVSYFTLESTLCTYKGWHRPNRRYPNVYNDMLHDRIVAAEQTHGDESQSGVFWEARETCLPDHLLLEKNPADPGLHPDKQNHYRLTGEVIMMDVEYPKYRNSFNDRVRATQAATL